jgi:hypothetical protein
VGFQPFTMRGMGRTVMGRQVQALMGLIEVALFRQ